MAKAQIGFVLDAPENPRSKWERKLDGATVIYTKTCVGGDFFIYNCEWRRENKATTTSWQTSSDMTPDEVERIPRFLDLLAGKI